MINMSAGQTMMTPSCLRALSGQMETPIYYPAYWDIEEETLALSQRLLGTGSDVLFLAGSATFGEEAALRSTMEPGDKIVVVNAGVFGQVAVDLVSIVGCTPIEIKVPHGSRVDLAEVERALRADGVRGFFAVHVETSTGTAYPLAELGALARSRGILFLVDAVSSVGGTAFRMDEWGVDVAITSPQKCLSGPQGIAVVAVSDRAWKAVAAKKTANNSLCLDLTVWKRYHDTKVRAMNQAWRDDAHEPHVAGRAKHEPSPSGPLVRGFHGALADLFNEGIDHFRRRHEVSAKAVREAVRALGLRLVAQEEEIASAVVTVFYLPAGIYEKDFRVRLLKDWGVAIGNGEIGPNNVRVGTMGVGAQPRFVLPTIQALESTLRSLGHQFDPGAGLRAAESVFAANRDINWSRVS